MPKKPIHTDQAPAAVGTYSQAIDAGGFVFISGQIPLDPKTMDLVEGPEPQIRQVFSNLAAVCAAAGATLDDIVRLSVYLADLADFSKVNEVMGELFSEPYPARAAFQVAALPKGARIEVEAIVQRPGP